MNGNFHKRIKLAISLLLVLFMAGFAIKQSPPGVAQLIPQDTEQNSQSIEQKPPTRHPPQEPIGVRKNGILLVYPHSGSSINSHTSYIIGAVAPGTTLSVNGSSVHVNSAGLFANVIPLSIGTNHFSLVPNGDESKAFEFNVTRPGPPTPVPASPLQILRSSIRPKSNLGLQPGDIVTFSMHASPGAMATVLLGNREIKLHSSGKASAVNRGRDTAYGVTYQQAPPSSSDLYTGFYRITAGDTMQDETPIFKLTRDQDTVQEPGQGHITAGAQPFVATTVHNDTIVRVGPGAGRTTPWSEGVRVLVDGFVGDSYRCEMTTGKHLWVEKSDLQETTETPGEPPNAVVHTINIENEGATGARIVLPLDQRLPYEVKQEISPQNRLILKLYGATADTDWITQPGSTNPRTVPPSNEASGPGAKSPTPQGRAYPPVAERSHNPVTYVNWQQLTDHLYQVSVNLNENQQWGFWVTYEGSDLVLHIKGKPTFPYSATSLAGLKICIDPGHGGMETGAIGASGTKEATVNLAIAKHTERLLKNQGADVIMTRTADIDVSLPDRVAIALKNNCDLLVSIHCNSLPDGLDPWVQRGTSSYYYHPQSLALASEIRQGVLKHLGFNDFHTRWQNLHVCRPSQIPAQLVEVGFMPNPDELAVLLTDDGQEKAARGIVSGVHAFLQQALAPASAKPSTRKPSTSKSSSCKPTAGKSARTRLRTTTKRRQ